MLVEDFDIRIHDYPKPPAPQLLDWFELVLCAAVSFRYGYRESLKEYLE